jgi:ABC-2 type transport system ATP-binding protein
MAAPIITVSDLTKTYATGLAALKRVNLTIESGEIFALLGPNGAGKTTLINIICGIVTASSGSVDVAGHDVVRDYRTTRALIGLVPQELVGDPWVTVIDTVRFSRGIFGKPADSRYLEQTLRDLALWSKRHDTIRTLSGGMKRRVLIAKALAHQPNILFLDEPTAGVDVELRREMWSLVRRLKESGVTIVLTTHYIEEAEEMADRIGVINKGELIVVDDKRRLMQNFGKKHLSLHLTAPLQALPGGLAEWKAHLAPDGKTMHIEFDSRHEQGAIAPLLQRLAQLGIGIKDLDTSQTSLEEIFIDLLHDGEDA